MTQWLMGVNGRLAMTRAELLTPRLKFARRMMAPRLHPSVGICI
jgi:hypothetical protein